MPIPTQTHPTDPDAARELLRLADQCVKCGLCLPHCPTFAQAHNEADSPRGRISLVQGWASGALPLSPTLIGHLDGCLGCLNCERVCPSGVAYGHIADTAKALWIAAIPRWRRQLRLARLSALSSAALTRPLAWMTRRYTDLGLARLMERARLAGLAAIAPYHRLARSMGLASRPVRARATPAADVELFLGCMGEAAQGHAAEAFLQVAERLGARVRIRPESACCGAMLRHGGFPAQAAARLDACAQRQDDDSVVGLASACVAELRTHPGLARTQEACAYLDQIDWPDEVRLRPVPLRVLVHEPCTHRNQLGGNAPVHRLLARIPGLAIGPLPPGQGCCGAAGTYLLEHPEMARALADALIGPLQDDPPDLILTTNPGCALHLAAALREAGLATAVRHPVELIAEAIGLDPDPNTRTPQ